MRLKTAKRLLNLASLLVVGTAGAVGYWGLMPVSNIDIDVPESGDPAPTAKLTAREAARARTQSATTAASAGLSGNSLAVNWGRALRRPLFDPPPPAPIVVAEKPPQPLHIRLLATVIESENSVAMLKQANGQVVFRKVGESLGPEEPSAEIFKIETGAIRIRRGHEDIRLSVEGTNGK